MRRAITLIATSCCLIGCTRDRGPAEEITDQAIEAAILDMEKVIEEFNNRTIYTEFDESTLASIPDDELEQAIVDFVHHKVGDNWEQDYQIATSLPKPFQYVYASWLLEAEVNNGGYNQYFWNSSGDYIMEAIEGLEAIGAPKTAELTRNAAKLAQKEEDLRDRFKQQGTIESFMKSYEFTNLGQFDDEFYKYNEDLSALRIQYIRDNAKAFVTK